MGASIRTRETKAGQFAAGSKAVADIYNGTLDAVIVHQAFPEAALQHARHCLQRGDSGAQWHRPNKPVPGIDLRLLGISATPTATTPYGPEPEAYFSACAATASAVRNLFGEDFNPFTTIETRIAEISGTTVELAVSAQQRPYSAATVRSIPAGEGLMIHHDSHLGLAIYEDLLTQLDTALQLSFFIVLQHPQQGGRLCIYALGPDGDADMPRLDSGMLDPAAFHKQVPHEYFDLAEGDMLVFGSGRLYHSVETVLGPVPRVTIGGFLGLDKAHQRCLYWS